jgi:hypothetical protein
MRTSNILTIGGAFIALIGGAFGLLMLKVFLGSGSRGFADLAGLFVGAIVCALGIGLVLFGRSRSRVEAENDERNFSDAVLALAKKNGQVTVDQVCKVSGLSREDATTRMRALTGRGFFDIDFDQAGQMVWKLSPDAGRAQLAEMAGRSS